VRFEWDEDKNRANQRKHQLSFETASLVFSDPLHRSLLDLVIEGEQRWQSMGMVDGVLLLLVAHTVRDEAEDTVIRIVSARKATKLERRQYEEEG
jgi:uncharacterized DUF497 family protein